MSMLDQNSREPESPGALLSEILKDALDEDEQLWAFRQWFDEKLRYPLHGFVLGEPVLVQEICYDGNRRRGLTAACQKLNDERYVINLADIEFPKDSDAGQYLTAYRRWQGPDYRRNPRDLRNALRQGRTIKSEGLVNLAVLAVREQFVRCRFKDKLREVTCHLSNFTRFVPGESVTVQVRKMWHQSSYLQLSGFLLESRIDMATIDLPSQRLVERGTWDPAEHDWPNQEEPPPEWVQNIMQAGPRPVCEMEKFTTFPEGSDQDAIQRSVELKESGYYMEAKQILMNVTERELWHIDAHAHLGNLEFEQRPDTALKHFEVGRQIGELSFSRESLVLLPWSWVNNRPYLRCLHGYGLSLWRLERLEDAKSVFKRLLWLNPCDNQGIRFLLQDLRNGMKWEERSIEGSKPTPESTRGESHAESKSSRSTRSISAGERNPLPEKVRLADDLDRKWPVEDLLEVLRPATMTRKALAQFWECENKAEMSLRDLMDLTIVDDVDSKPGHLVTRLLDLRCVGVKGFWTVVDRLTATDLGVECNVEWNRRLVKLEGCWRMQGTKTYSKPCRRPSTSDFRKRDQQIQQMNQAGISHREIARQYDRSESLVRNVVRRLTTEEELECKLSILDEQMRSSDDPDKNWPVGDILDALRLRKATRKALIGHLNAKETDLISLRRLMNVVIEEDIDPWSDTPWPILFKVRNIGIKGYRSILGGIGRLQLGEKCRREWEQIAKAFLERHLNQ